MGLQHLPVRPTVGDNVQKAYITELHKVETPEQLKEFVARWKPLYNLELESERWKDHDGKQGWVRDYKTRDAYVALCKGEIDYAEALRCIKKGMVPLGSVAMEGEVCEHAPHFSCPGVHIALPMVLMHAFFVGQEYGVPTDIAIIQANGGYSEEFQP